ncbi:uncharacterized protein LOC107882602 [Acyrthosiphon pisum]|uniref:Uncharacterized protein n=1 Tax=Acyrthosiphon pisum TaxID=7029 RepID=A0A8R2NLL7_ACYPI|nr:uncharacterized protein LOC107882602 [Acyrthosiphon pisum]
MEADGIVEGFLKSVEMHGLKYNRLIAQKIKGIQKDLANAPFHRLGQHTNCDSYFCNGSNLQNTLNLVPEAENNEIMSEIQNIMSRLITNAESLLEN